MRVSCRTSGAARVGVAPSPSDSTQTRSVTHASGPIRNTSYVDKSLYKATVCSWFNEFKPVFDGRSNEWSTTAVNELIEVNRRSTCAEFGVQCGLQQEVGLRLYKNTFGSNTPLIRWGRHRLTKAQIHY
ncbi:hypothetical protein EVAR_54507_1 [Eumeta japonica]|uniref:Uncharacterized protein n=1 Tax=Eumeta variegata TaxID=151549 RepID=A0A4C1YK98_EUMVA|nr:hypothetical protein EVAR_54507_1 [Eumeta japonica]